MRRCICFLMSLLLILSASGCAKSVKSDGEGTEHVEANSSVNTESEAKKFVIEHPNLTQIRSICKLATLECYYHNVARSVKEAGSGLSHMGEHDRKFWTEYNGVAKIGVDMSRGSMEVNGTEITIFMPEAEILSIKPDAESVSEPIVDSDGFINKNPIEAEDVTGAIDVAQEEIVKKIKEDSSLLVSAQDRAKKLIENYINQLGEASGIDFTIKWEAVNDSTELSE